MPDDWRFRGWRKLEDAIRRFTEARPQSAAPLYEAALSALNHRIEEVVYALLVDPRNPPGYQVRPNSRDGSLYRLLLPWQGMRWWMTYRLSDEHRAAGTIEILALHHEPLSDYQTVGVDDERGEDPLIESEGDSISLPMTFLTAEQFGIPRVGPDGAHLESAAQRFIERVIRTGDFDIEELRKIHPDDFEDFVAELFIREGLAVQRTPHSNDKGVDLFVAGRDQHGKSLWVVQCKRYAGHNVIKPAAVRELVGTVDMTRATGGMLVTTSTFTKPVRKEAETGQFRYRLRLRDYEDIAAWLQRLGFVPR